MSMIPCLFSLVVTLMRQACVCLSSDPDVCRLSPGYRLLTHSLVTDASVDVEKSQSASTRSEMAMFESSGKRGRGLLVYVYRRHQSTQKERFPPLAYCTKVRSQLSDKSIDTLCFLRSYYQKNKQ